MVVSYLLITYTLDIVAILWGEFNLDYAAQVIFITNQTRVAMFFCSILFIKIKPYMYNFDIKTKLKNMLHS